MRFSVTLVGGLLLTLASLAPLANAQGPSAASRADSGGNAASDQTSAIVIPELVADPLEPINRGIWGFNTVVINHFLHPVGKGYRYIVREPVREKVNNFSRNLTYPGRLINHTLQGRWSGARAETRRFFTNSTLGVAGIFDPATSFGMEKSDADLGQTFGRWGWDPNFYVIIPILGPSNDRDGIGLAGDTGMNPLVWVPMPYSYGLYGLSFNLISDKTAEYKRITEAGTDSYAFARQAYSYVRANKVDDFRITEMPAEPALSSLNAIFFTQQQPKFPEQAQTRSTRLPNGESMKYSVWLQDAPAPVVYLLPGLGGNRLERPSLALAELIYMRGCSVVSVSSIYNSEFMESASTVAVPGHPDYDHRDLHVALDAIDPDLSSKYHDRLGRRAVLGFSMGGFQALKLAAHHQHGGDDPRAGMIRFDRYIAINPPVDLMYGLGKLDEFYEDALDWPADQRTARIDTAFRKVAHLVSLAGLEKTGKQPDGEGPPVLPFDRTESGFLIGYAYRTILRDIIYSSQRRHDLGVLQEPVRKFRRADVYAEIERYNFHDYLQSFVIPYYQSGAAGANAAAEIARAASLKSSSGELRSRGDQLRIIFSSDDFLLREGDAAWLRGLAPAKHVTVFDHGGHMGQLAEQAGQAAVAQSLDGL